jgi:phytoene dehydrogenase-like protein
VRTGARVASMRDVPESRAVIFDVTARQLASIAGDALPSQFTRKLNRFRYGPGLFKIDWALNGPIPWRARECGGASTVHVGGTFEEIARHEAEVWRGRSSQRPFVILGQQSLFDPTRAPAGKQTAWGYCHVPNGSTEDMTDAIEKQVERFAPGFRDRILARHTMNTAELEAHNSNLVGGDIAGGANTLRQIVFRPVVQLNPYTTPNPRLFIGSSSTPPGGGVHGMCGYLAARAAIRTMFRSA